MRPGTFSFALPLLAIFSVAFVMISLGAIFSVVGNLGTMVLGLAIMISTGIGGYLLTRKK